jgi:hypothetical protein
MAEPEPSPKRSEVRRPDIPANAPAVTFYQFDFSVHAKQVLHGS